MEQNNIVISGDEARVIMQAMVTEGTAYPGPLLPLVTNLLIKLQNLSNNQPPKAATGERNE